MDNLPLFNSRIISTYVEYLKTHYPEIDIDAVLNYSGISPYEMEDQGHWLTQQQIDLFLNIIFKHIPT